MTCPKSISKRVNLNGNTTLSCGLVGRVFGEKESYLNATSEDTIRSKAWTGKPARMLKNKWTEAWENPENPDPLPMPLQGMITFDAMRRTSIYAGSGNTQDVSFNAAGQVIGQIKQIDSVKDVMFGLISEYLDSVERLNDLLPKE